MEAVNVPDPQDAVRRRRREMGAFLRQKRGAMRPADLGLATIGRRHVRGLRREEVASAARIGVSWYTMLEQGRVSSVTARTLDAVAEVLRLTRQERAHLRSLASGSLDAQTTDFGPLPGALLDFVRDYPLGGAFVHDALFNVVVANAWSAGLFDFDRLAERNILRVMTTHAPLRERFIAPDWTETLGHMVTHYRRRYAESHSAAHDALVDELCERSPEFRTIWLSRHVDGPPTERCTIRHRDAGVVDVLLIALVPPSSPTHTVIFNNRLSAPAQPSGTSTIIV